MRRMADFESRPSLGSEWERPQSGSPPNGPSLTEVSGGTGKTESSMTSTKRSKSLEIVFGSLKMRNKAPQCYHCQQCGHFARYCLRSAHCGYCAGYHTTWDHKRSATGAEFTVQKCVLCGKKGHTAWDPYCEVSIGQIRS